MVIKKIKEGLSRLIRPRSSAEEYIEIDLGSAVPRKAKILIRPFVLKVFEDINPVLNALREGYTIALVDIKQLKGKDIVELKRAIAKLKKTCDALEGSITGFGENTIVAAPSFAEIYRGEKMVKVREIKGV